MPEYKSTKIQPLLLCGGVGKRLWPLSRSSYPKQFVKIFNSRSLLQNTIERVLSLNCFLSPIIIGNNKNRFEIQSQLSELHLPNFTALFEPLSRNTAPAVLIASLFILAYKEDQLIMLMPVDHKLDPTEAFKKSVEVGIPFALAGELVVFGVKPNSPNTNYGYIQVTNQISDQTYRVKAFTEKPSKQRALLFIEDDSYFWNAGMLLFKASSMVKAFEENAPEMINIAKEIVMQLKSANNTYVIPQKLYQLMPNISLDYAILEKCNSIVMSEFAGEWNDIGTLTALYEIGKKDQHGNVNYGDVFTLDSTNNYIRAENKLLVTMGIKDLIVIETRDAILIAKKNSVDDIEKVINFLAKMERTEAKSSPKVYRPWGYFITLENETNYKVKKIVVLPKQSLSLQSHQYRSEHWIVLKGKAHITLGHSHTILYPNHSIFVPLGMRHRIQNFEESPLEIIEIQTGDYLGEDDIKRYADIYERESTEV